MRRNGENICSQFSNRVDTNGPLVYIYTYNQKSCNISDEKLLIHPLTQENIED